MRTIALTFAIVYGASLAVLICLHMQPAVPWAFVLGIAAVFVPLAYLATEGLYLLRDRVEQLGTWRKPAALIFGSIGLAAYALLPNTSAVILLLLLACFVHLVILRRELIRPLAWSMLVLVFMFGAIWNLNQAVGPFTLGRLKDAEMIAAELTLYRYIVGHPVSAEGLFPWHSPRWLFSIIETAYFLLFCELFVVIFVHARQRISAAGFFATSFAAYLIGLAVFCCYPIVGPICTDPRMFAQSYQDTNTYFLTVQQAGSYADILAQRPCRGFAYLVALPSLHVAMAMIMQRFLAQSPIHFWAFLPVNILMSLATVYLGFHYFVDIVGGLVLAEIVLAGYGTCQKRWARQALPGPSVSEEIKKPQVELLAC